MGGQRGRQNFFVAGALAWQNEPGSSQLGCCTVNGPRVLGMLSEWGLMKLGSGQGSGYAVNYYGPGSMSTPELTLRQDTAYPFEPLVDITLAKVAKDAGALSLWLRIPSWSKQTIVTMNGKPCTAPIVPGKYLKVTRQWAAGDKLSITFDFRLRGWTASTDAIVEDEPAPIVSDPCGLCGVPAAIDSASAQPVWDSTEDGGWASTGKHFAGTEPPQAIPLPSLGKIAQRPTTMMGWICQSEWATTTDVSYVWSCGGADAMKRGAAVDDCRALAIQPSACCKLSMRNQPYPDFLPLVTQLAPQVTSVVAAAICMASSRATRRRNGRTR